ncbi:uncharacterized protein LOC144568664 [Carex rostrata]
MDGDTNGISLINWNSVCLPREWGGLGAPDIELRNISLLLRWWWQLYTDANGLWKTAIIVLKGRGSVRLKNTFDRCCSWRIGDGRRISFWYNNWTDTPILEAFTDIARSPRGNISLIPMLENVAPQVYQSLSCQFSSSRDELCWQLGNMTEYSSISVYNTMISARKIEWRYMAIWKCKAPENAKVFAYLLLKDKNLTHEVMIRRGFTVEPQCHTSIRDYLQTLLHLFFRCQYAQEVWSFVSNRLGHVLMVDKNSITEIWEASVKEARSLNGLKEMEWTTRFICVC